MCRRFTPVGAGVIGSSNDAGIGGAARSVGPVPDGTPKRTTPGVGEQVAEVGVALAALAVRRSSTKLHVSALTLGSETL